MRMRVPPPVATDEFSGPRLSFRGVASSDEVKESPCRQSRSSPSSQSPISAPT
jgi:hypothetical protein